MSVLIAEKFQSTLLALGAAMITIVVTSGNVTDPVNVPKLLTLGILGAASVSVALAGSLNSRLRNHWISIIFVSIFVIASLSATLQSKSPVSQNLYGAYGRNNGFLAYLFLSLIFISILTLKEQDSFKRLLKALYVAGGVNIAYCLWVISFGDFIGWSNPYGNILGTLGNPNFIGSFLGIFLGAYFAQLFTTSSSKFFRILGLLIIPLTVFEIVKSHAIQGRVVAALGLAVALFYFLRSKYNLVIVSLYSLVVVAVGVFSLLGALQIGPLASYIYKTSVSLRGQYWLAGWNTGQSHPFSGVGMDAFGDWYRRSRDARAIELPGVNTVVNASHNVPLDMFAFGGWPLFLAYLAIICLTIIAVIRVTLRTRTYDPIFVSLTAAWLGYQVQSLISINQIGLAIWGWILSAALISYEYASRENVLLNQSLDSMGRRASKNSRNSSSQQLHLPVFGILGGIIGLIVALPPFTADVKWRAAQVAQSAARLEASLAPSYFNPPNSMKYLTTIQIFEENQLFEQSHKLALEAVSWNPEAFELWKVLYLIKNSTSDEKTMALANMKRLDPLNPDVTSIK